MVPEDEEIEFFNTDDLAMPLEESIDWRKEGVVGVVKNQL